MARVRGDGRGGQQRAFPNDPPLAIGRTRGIRQDSAARAPTALSAPEHKRPKIEPDVVRNRNPAYTGVGVITICDTGIDIFHKNFRVADSSMHIRWIWDQTLNASGAERRSTGQSIGVEFTCGDINVFTHQ